MRVVIPLLVTLALALPAAAQGRPSRSPFEGDARLDKRITVPELPLPKALFKALGPQVEQAIGKAEKGMQEGWARGNGFRVTVQLNLNLGAQPLGMLRVSPEPLGTEGALGPLMALSGLNITGSPTVLPEAGEDPAARVKRLSEHPILGKKAVLKLPSLPQQKGLFAILGQSYRSAEILSNVEEAFGVHLLGDAYHRQALTLFPPPPEAPQPLYKVLDTLAGVGREWELDGNVVRMRSRQWAHDRRAEIPVRYMRRWLAVREKKGGFTLEDLAEIVTLLRDEQVESLMFSALEADGGQDFADFVMISSNREPLRLYGRLLPTQRQALQAGREIPVRQLFPYQQRQLLGMNRRQNQSLFSMAMGAKPQRTPAQLAEATLSLQRREITAEQRQRAEGALGGQRQGPAAPFNIPDTIYTFTLAFPTGEKDSYTLPLGKPAVRPAGGVE